jgi:Putative polyhydroxyalkanoic acid system protein (PHA_gran_rgn)
LKGGENHVSTARRFDPAPSRSRGGRASSQIGAWPCRWEGDHLNFRIRALNQVATGQVDVGEDHVRVEVMLPWLLQRFAEMAQATIRKRGQLLLTKGDGK